MHNDAADILFGRPLRKDVSRKRIAVRMVERERAECEGGRRLPPSARRSALWSVVDQPKCAIDHAKCLVQIARSNRQGNPHQTVGGVASTLPELFDGPHCGVEVRRRHQVCDRRRQSTSIGRFGVNRSQHLNRRWFPEVKWSTLQGPK